MTAANQKKYIFYWLITGCVMIWAMVVIGGITRLTGSGLSITEWNLFMGTFPPMNDSQWNEVFQKYQQSPQFQKVNYDFKMDEFKSIFWWEYIHRLVGRMIGIVFIVPFAFFVYKKWIDTVLLKKTIFLFLLGGLQGFVGWWMVYSGLINVPSVSHYRLATHLLTAFFTFGLTFWFALDLLPQKQDSGKNLSSLKVLSVLFLGLVVMQIFYGALVAGLHAGKIYNTFPQMGDGYMPEAVTAMSPFWKNLLENMAGVQFVHRCLAFFLLLFGLGMYLEVNNISPSSKIKNAFYLLLCALGFQFLAGVITLLLAVPVELGVLHQSGAFILFASALYFRHSILRN